MIEKTYPVTEQLVTNALQLAQQLLQELNQEAGILKNPGQPTELLSNIAANKRQLVEQMEQFNSHLSQVLSLEKLPNSQEGMNEYFKRAEAANLQTTNLVGKWTQLMQICADCRDLNEQNGASIDLLSRHAKRSLDIIKGKPETASTYGSNGITQSERHVRTLISV
ncbi:MAG: flagella synthesis protein FlgN [Methylobacter sp.]